MTTPRVSVIIATRNSERFLRECLESVVMQTYKDWECLVIDDASTDATGEIAQEYAALYANFNACTNTTRLTALPNLIDMIRRARGEIVVLLDGDDYFPHDACLGRIVAEYDSDPEIDATYGCYVRETDGGVGHMRPVPPDKRFWEGWWYGHPLTWKRELSLQSFAEEPQSYLDPRTQSYYKSTYDLALFYPICWRARKVAFIRDVLYLYRDQTGDNDHSTPERHALQRSCHEYIATFWARKDGSNVTLRIG